MKRTRRNRKKYRAREQGFAFPLPMAVPLALIVAAALFFLWLDSRCEAQGVRIQRLEQQVRDAESRRLNEEFKWQTLRSPGHIERALQRHGLRMTWPDQNRLVQVAYDPDFGRPGVDRPEALSTAQLVRRD